MYDYYDDYSYYDGYSAGFDAIDILSAIPEFIEKVGILFMLVTLVIGIVQCFWGYKLYRFTIAVSGFITGSALGGALGILLAIGANIESIKGALAFVLLSMLGIGIIGAAVAYNFELIGAFLVGFSGVYVFSLIMSLVSKVMSGDDSIASCFFTAAIPAVIAGIIVVKFWKPIVIIYTGLSGALCIAIGTGIGLIAFIGCSIGGIYYQIKSNNGLRENDEPTQVSAPQKEISYSNNNTLNTARPVEQPPKIKKENEYPEIID